MRITELLISLLISVLVSANVFFTYSVFLNCYSKIITSEKKNEKILKVDNLIRKEISAFRIPYWITTSDELLFLENNIRFILIRNECEVNKISIIQWKNLDCGINVEWEYKGKSVMTKEMFLSSRYLFERQ